MLYAKITVEHLFDEGLIRLRTRNVCLHNRLLSLREIYQHYLDQGDFLTLTKGGTKTSQELLRLCDEYRTSGSYDSEQDEYLVREPEPDELTRFARQYAACDRHAKISVHYRFQQLRNDLSNRSRNVLERFFGGNVEDFLTRSAHIRFDYSTIRGVGVLCGNELHQLVSRLATAHFADARKEGVDTLRRESLLSEIEMVTGTVHPDTLALIDRYFDEGADQELLLLHILESVFQVYSFVQPRYARLVLGYFQTEWTDESEIVDRFHLEMGLTKERIRQLIRIHKIHLSALEGLAMLCGRLAASGFQSRWMNLSGNIYTQSELAGILRGTSFSSRFAGHFLSQVNPDYEFKSLHRLPNGHFLVRRRLSEAVDVAALLSDLHRRLSTGVHQAYRLPLHDLVGTHSRVPGTAAAWMAIASEDLERLIGAVCGISAESGVFVLQRNTRRRSHEYVVDLFTEAQTALSIGEITGLLEARQLYFSEEKLRSILQKRNLFVVVGSSVYALKDWEADGRINGGTIKQLVQKYLHTLNRPAHIHEISDYVLQHRNTNLKSVYRNLRSDPVQHFVYFGQGFFGLSEKSYPKAATRFRSVNRHWFDRVRNLLPAGERMARTDLVASLAEYFRVYPVQIDFLVSLRVQSGDLLEQDGWLSVEEIPESLALVMQHS